MPKKKKYYAYVVPNGPTGVTDNWNECEKIVSGRPGARYRAFPDIYAAERWLHEGAKYEASAPTPNGGLGLNAKRPSLGVGVYFDSGTGRGEGVEISVTDEKGKNLLHKAIQKKELNRFGKNLLGDTSFTNNYGELLALKYALQIAQKSKIKKIFGDSKLVIDYWSKRRIKRKDLPEATVTLADEVSKLREAFEKGGGAVDRISGDYNPADLGFHR